MLVDEKKIKEIAKSYLQSARAGDWEHTLRVVEWTKQLGTGREDLPPLIVAAYLHDVGWSGLAPDGKVDLKEMKSLEPQANENSKKTISEILTTLSFSGEEILTVQRLVGAADKHLASKEDEQIIVDADNLSKLNSEHLREKYQPESFSAVIGLWEREFPKRIMTTEGKRIFPGLLQELKTQIYAEEN